MEQKQLTGAIGAKCSILYMKISHPCPFDPSWGFVKWKLFHEMQTLNLTELG